MTASKSKDHQYIIDSEGNKVAVLLPIEEYQQLLEDLYDGQAVRDRRNDLTISFDEMKSRLGLDE